MTSRFLYYSHDSFGLGHLRRTLALARAVTEHDADAGALILTGSAMASSYRLPARVDTLKLPTVLKEDNGSYRAMRLPMDTAAVRDLRAGVAAAAASAYHPSVVVVDKTPLGLRAEFEPALKLLRERGGCRLVLGMRDVDDSPRNVRREWRGRGLAELIEAYYDAVLVYGPDSTMDALDVLGVEGLGVPIDHVGYVVPPIPAEGPPDLPQEYLLVTVGGGGDGRTVTSAFARAVSERPLPLPSVIVTGPLMSDADLAELHVLTANLDVTVHEFRPDMESVIAGARAVVAMAGYNTVAELTLARKPALLVPRVRPREEQLVRARSLAEQGLAAMIHPDELTPGSLRRALDELLERPPVNGQGGPVDGAERSARILHRLAEDASRAAPRPVVPAV